MRAGGRRDDLESAAIAALADAGAALASVGATEAIKRLAPADRANARRELRTIIESAGAMLKALEG